MAQMEKEQWWDPYDDDIQRYYDVKPCGCKKVCNKVMNRNGSGLAYYPATLCQIFCKEHAFEPKYLAVLED